MVPKLMAHSMVANIKSTMRCQILLPHHSHFVNCWGSLNYYRKIDAVIPPIVVSRVAHHFYNVTRFESYLFRFSTPKQISSSPIVIFISMRTRGNEIRIRVFTP